MRQTPTPTIGAAPTVTPDGLTIPMASILGTLGTLGLGIVVWLVRRELAHHERRLEKIEAGIEERQRSTDALEGKISSQLDMLKNQLTELRMDLPLRYVTEQVFTRQQDKLQASMDALHRRLDEALRDK